MIKKGGSDWLFFQIDGELLLQLVVSVPFLVLEE